ncbi:MAG: VCBS repeat-containing protein, partial [Planctomycetes bacterium]|nr:VCBS repeat-containing protein [Planctomycetota bacterium]
MRIPMAALVCAGACIGGSRELEARQLRPPYFVNETLPAGPYARSEFVDLDADGRLDLVCVTQQASVRSFLGDGFGGFVPAGTENLAFGMLDFAVGDVQGDGDPDVVVLLADGRIAVLLGDGLGHLSLAATLIGVSQPQAIALGDVNADGRADLVVSILANKVLVFTASATTFYSGAPIPLSTDASPRRAVVRDVTGDGIVDIACVSPVSGNINVFHGNGSGGFGSAQLWFAGLTTERFAVDDLDADGIVDFVCPRVASILLSVLRG